MELLSVLTRIWKTLVSRLGFRRSKGLPKQAALRNKGSEERQRQISLSRGGTEKLAPIGDSVWYGFYKPDWGDEVIDSYSRRWVASAVSESRIQPVANLGEGLG